MIAWERVVAKEAGGLVELGVRELERGQWQRLESNMSSCLR